MNIDMRIQARTVVVERLKFHWNAHIPYYDLMLRSEAEFFADLDHMLDAMVARVAASVIKGEIVEESRTIKHQVNGERVFATWKDHLKFAIRRDWRWLPEWAVKLIVVRYQPLKTSEIEISVPVKVTKICPHAGFSWDGKPFRHLQFLRPMEFSDIGRLGDLREPE